MKTLLGQRTHAVTPTALLLLILMIVTMLSTAAFAAVGGGGTNTTTYTTSTKNIYDTTTASVNQQVNTYSTQLIAIMQGSSTALYDQTFNVAFSDLAVQAAIQSAKDALTGSGASSFTGPTLLSDSTSLVGSASQVGAPVVTSTDVSYATDVYIGPQTIWVGDNQSIAFAIPAGGENFDTLITSLIHQVITTTTTDTFLTTDVYQLVGVPAAAPAPVPEPATMLLLGSGLIGFAGFRKKFKK
jgi:hypothetical protein